MAKGRAAYPGVAVLPLTISNIPVPVPSGTYTNLPRTIRYISNCEDSENSLPPIVYGSSAVEAEALNDEFDSAVVSPPVPDVACVILYGTPVILVLNTLLCKEPFEKPFLLLLRPFFLR
jgi:hypothetical protein